MSGSFTHIANKTLLKMTQGKKTVSPSVMKSDGHKFNRENVEVYPAGA